MKKLFIFGGILLIGLLVILHQTTADDPDPQELSEQAIGVLTSNGVIDLPEGTMVGGQPENYIILEETVTLQTTLGPQNFTNGTLIDCEHEPWEPDPCTGSR